MAAPVMMPKQGQSVETCIINEWMKKKGDKVAKGDVLFSYETDKASFEYEAEEEGTLIEIFFEEGDEVPVLTNVAVIGDEGESTDEFRPDGKQDNEPEEEEKTKQPQKATKEEVEVTRKAEETGEAVKISPRAKKMAEQLGVYYQNIAGSGPHGRIIERDIQAAAKDMPKTTRAAQKKAEEEGLKPDAATGIGGRATTDNLVQAGKASGAEYEVKPLSNVRKIIAKSMHQSLQNSAQLTHHMSADVRKLQAFRRKVKKAMAEGSQDNITLNDMICFAVIKALKKHPDMNSHFLGEEIKLFNFVHLGLAVDTPRGLMVPSLRNADSLSLKDLSVALKNLAEQCRQGTIDPDLISSEAASFTVSNLGNYGVEMFTPVLNLPQSGILGVNTIQYKPADMGDGNIGFVPHIGLSLTYDHRSVDGAPATLFLKEVKEQIENFSEEL